jgi:hypothetical protein
VYFLLIVFALWIVSLKVKRQYFLGFIPIAFILYVTVMNQNFGFTNEPVDTIYGVKLGTQVESYSTLKKTEDEYELELNSSLPEAILRVKADYAGNIERVYVSVSFLSSEAAHSFKDDLKKSLSKKYGNSLNYILGGLSYSDRKNLLLVRDVTELTSGKFNVSMSLSYLDKDFNSSNLEAEGSKRLVEAL